MSFKQKMVRLATNVQCDCYAKPSLFKPWEKLSQSAKNEFLIHGPIPCGGGGVPGIWCADCRFGKLHDPQEVD